MFMKSLMIFIIFSQGQHSGRCSPPWLGNHQAPWGTVEQSAWDTNLSWAPRATHVHQAPGELWTSAGQCSTHVMPVAAFFSNHSKTLLYMWLLSDRVCFHFFLKWKITNFWNVVMWNKWMGDGGVQVLVFVCRRVAIWGWRLRYSRPVIPSSASSGSRMAFSWPLVSVLAGLYQI